LAQSDRLEFENDVGCWEMNVHRGTNADESRNVGRSEIGRVSPPTPANKRGSWPCRRGRHPTIVKRTPPTAVISVGSPVKRPYGIEVLKISRDAVIPTRIKNGGIPLLDSHDQYGLDNALGRVVAAWVEGGKLFGTFKFNLTDKGRRAEGMVARGEIGGISAGYRVVTWEIKDKDGHVLDPEIDRIRYDDGLTWTAVRWELLEASLVTVPADVMASVRSAGGDCAVPAAVWRVADLIGRMKARARMHRAASAQRSRSATRARMIAREIQREAQAATLSRMRCRQRMIDRSLARLST
jgi:hypothetical protein